MKMFFENYEEAKKAAFSKMKALEREGIESTLEPTSAQCDCGESGGFGLSTKEDTFLYLQCESCALNYDGLPY